MVSCSWDESLIIYSPYNKKYIKDYQIKANGFCEGVFQTKENEICYSEYSNRYYSNSLFFYDLLEKKIIATIKNIDNQCCHMIAKDSLLIIGFEKLIIIDVNTHNILRKIKVRNSRNVYASCMLNNNNFIFGDEQNNIQQWRIEGNNFKLISIKEKAHDNKIFTLLLLGNGHILSGDSNGEIKIW